MSRGPPARKLPGSVLDGINVQLLRALVDEPRLTMSELSRRVGLSAPAVAERVQRLHEAGVITGYRLDLNPSALGLPVAAYVRVRPGPGQAAQVAALAREMPHVVECHRISGEDGFLLKVHLAAVDQLDAVLDGFMALGQTTTSIVQSSPVPLRPPPIPNESP